MADSRIVNLSTVTLNSKNSSAQAGQGQDSQEEQDTGSIGEVPDEEVYITGLEGIGHIESLATLDGLEFSTGSTTATAKTSSATPTMSGVKSVTSLDPLARASTIGTVASSSTVADPEKRTSETFTWIERILELFYNGGTSKTAQDVGSAILHKLFNCEDGKTLLYGLLPIGIRGREGQGSSKNYTLTHLAEDHKVKCNREDYEDMEAKLRVPISEEDRKVTLVDYEITPFDQPTMLNEEPLPMLSKMLSLKVKYQVKSHVGLNYELFVVKLPPETAGERDLATKTNAHHREICFYNRILPFLQEWSRQQGVQAQFGIPICIFGNYRREFDEKPVLLDEISNVESVLMLEDVRADEFGKRHFIEGMSIEEAKAAIAEICKIHVASWAFHQQDGYQSAVRGPAHKPPEVARLYEGLVQQGLKLLKAFLKKEMSKKTNYVPILEKIRSLELRIFPLLLELMELPKPPAPWCLIHMDFWCDNILFRQGDNPKPSPPAEEQQQQPNDNDDSEATGIARAAGTPELDSEAWRPIPFVPNYPAGLRLREDEANKPSDPVPSRPTDSSATIAADSNASVEPASSSSPKSNPFPKDLEYVTDPAYACVDLKDAAYNIVQDSLNNLKKKLIIKDSSLECRIIDWQLFSYGSPTHDLAILFLTSLTPEVRRKNTEMLLKYYLQVFDSTVEQYKLKAPFDLGCLRTQFSRSKYLAFLLLVANMEIVLADQTTRKRFMEVVKDLIDENVI